MLGLTLAQAETIADEALAEGGRRGFKPLTVVVLDAGGHAVLVKRQDRSSILRPQIATGKAYAALGMGSGTRTLAKRAEVAPAFVNALMDLSDGRVVPVPGGVLVRDASGDVLGAVGISGDNSDNDELCALAGIAKAGLQADTGE